MKKNIFIIELFLLMSFFSMLHAEEIISITLKKSKQDSNIIVCTLTNTSKDSLKILKSDIVLNNTINKNLFHIKLNNLNIPYVGKLIKRPSPIEDDYLTISAGDTYSSTINLAQYYDIKESTSYIVKYKNKITIQAKSYRYQIFKESSPIIQYLKVLSYQNTSSTKRQKKTYNSCTESEINIIALAKDEAIIISEDAKNIMMQETENTKADRYVTWFGISNITRQNNVLSTLNNIETTLKERNITFDCSCSEPNYAYVFPAEPYRIYLCDSFWEADLSGKDSQSGIIIHQLSHFNVVSSTKDHSNGSEEAKELAKNYPNYAIYNADSYEYFIENTPFLSMKNIFQEAITINILYDFPLSNTLNGISDKNIYKFKVSVSGIYHFYSMGDLDIEATLYDNHYINLNYNDDINNININFALTHYLVLGNTYYLKVNPSINNNGIYTLYSAFKADKNTLVWLTTLLYMTL